MSQKYELNDITYIKDIMYYKYGNWTQYDIVLAARGYGWEYMKSCADYMSKNDIDLTKGTLTITPFAGSKRETELIKMYHITKDIKLINELDNEQGTLAIGGKSKTLNAFVKIVWFNQTNRLRLFATIDNEELILKYIETVIRRTFGTLDEMKLAKPIPKQ